MSSPKHRTKYTKAEFSQKHKDAIEQFQLGLGYKAVATKLHVSVYTVRDWRRNWRYGIDTKAEPANANDKNKAISMRQKGCSLMDISRSLKVSKRTILRWLAQEKEGEI